MTTFFKSHGDSRFNPEAPDVFRALKQPGFETGSQALMTGSGLPLNASGASGWCILPRDVRTLTFGQRTVFNHSKLVSFSRGAESE